MAERWPGFLFGGTFGVLEGLSFAIVVDVEMEKGAFGRELLAFSGVVRMKPVYLAGARCIYSLVDRGKMSSVGLLLLKKFCAFQYWTVGANARTEDY